MGGKRTGLQLKVRAEGKTGVKQRERMTDEGGGGGSVL